MPDNPSKLFAKHTGGVCVELRIEDAMSLRPGWSETDAADFLHICSTHLAAKMLEAGVVELARLIRIGEELIAREEVNDADQAQS